MVERSAVNRRVAGSSPARGASSKWLVVDCDSLHQHKPDCSEWLEKVRLLSTQVIELCFFFGWLMGNENQEKLDVVIA